MRVELHLLHPPLLEVVEGMDAGFADASHFDLGRQVASRECQVALGSKRSAEAFPGQLIALADHPGELDLPVNTIRESSNPRGDRHRLRVVRLVNRRNE